MVAWPGGEPLWNVPNDLGIFSLLRGRPDPVLNRRLPETTARVVLSIVAFGGACLREEPTNLTCVETFPGAACLSEISGHARAETNIAGWSGTCRSGSPPKLSALRAYDALLAPELAGLFPETESAGKGVIVVHDPASRRDVL